VIFAVVGLSVWLIAMVVPARRSAEPDGPEDPGAHASPLPDPRIPSREPVGAPETVFL
jgi:hypothetical protein